VLGLVWLVLELVLATVIITWVNPRTFTPQFTSCHTRISAPPHFTHNRPVDTVSELLILQETISVSRPQTVSIGSRFYTDPFVHLQRRRPITALGL